MLLVELPTEKRVRQNTKINMNFQGIWRSLKYMTSKSRVYKNYDALDILKN